MTTLPESFVRKEDVAAWNKIVEKFQAETQANFDQVDQRLTNFQAETRANFEQVDQCFDQVDQRLEQVDSEFQKLRSEMAEGFKEMSRQIDRLGARWGIRNEALFRATMVSLLEKSFGVTVETHYLQGEQFDL